MEVNMYMEIHFYIPEFLPLNMDSVNDEHSQRYQQDLKYYEERYQGIRDMLCKYIYMKYVSQLLMVYLQRN